MVLVVQWHATKNKKLEKYFYVLKDFLLKKKLLRKMLLRVGDLAALV
jgi:hypothetical protein